MGTTSKSEYTQLCTEILEAVGGSKNVKNVFHCITRLRIVPVNRDAVDMEKLSKVSGILKVSEGRRIQRPDPVRHRHYRAGSVRRVSCNVRCGCRRFCGGRACHG